MFNQFFWKFVDITILNGLRFVLMGSSAFVIGGLFMTLGLIVSSLVV